MITKYSIIVRYNMRKITAYLLSAAILFSALPVNADSYSRVTAPEEFTEAFDAAAKNIPQSVSLSSYYLSIQVNETHLLTAKVLPESAENKNLIWYSSDESVATADSSGIIRGIGEGSAVVCAVTEVGRIKAVCNVTVSETGTNPEFDFSEWNMITNTSNYAEDGFDWDTAASGGNPTIAAAYLSRHDGAVLEENDEYPPYSSDSKSLYKECAADYHVQEIIWLPERTGADDNSEIKNAVVKYGAVSASYFSNEYYYNNNYLNYYQPADGSDSGYGHAIAIVGWDDNYSASNFKVTPPGDGAFICKNSWGTYFGDAGYFYISYYDKYLGKRNKMAVLTSLERNTNYNTVYQYDPLGTVGSYYYDEVSYGANVFPQHGDTLASNEILKAVSFYTHSKNTLYDVYVIKNYKNKSSLANLGKAAASGTISEMGYHTITLDSPVSLSAGTRFAVVIKLTLPDGQPHIYCEYPIVNYSSNARANEDESYLSGDGKYWDDFTTICKNGNLCIKAFTDNGSDSYSAKLFSAIDNSSRSYRNDKVYTLEEAIDGGFGISEDYIKYVRQKELDSSGSAPMTQGSFPDITGIDKSSVSSVNETVFPSRYDLREENSVSSVKNQGSWGTCWAFSIYASLESAILKKSKTFDASNNQITDVYQNGISPTGLTLSESSVTVAVNSTYRLYADILPSDATKRDVSWSSSNKKVISVDANGQITALKQGTATITCTTADGNYSAQCDVTAEIRTDAESISLAYNSATKAVGDTFLIDYQISPSNTSCSVTWSSDNPYVVSVNEYGLMTALSSGTANVTVNAGSGIFDTVNITVVRNSDLNITSLSNSLKLSGNRYSGSVSAFIDNKNTTAQTFNVILAVYDDTGRMVTARQNAAVLYSGENTVTFNEISLEKGSAESYSVKCFIWDNDLSSLKPIAAAVEDSINF